MLEHLNQLGAFDGPGEMAFVNFARQSQGDGRRQRSPIAGHPPEYGAAAFACPRRGQGFLKGEPEFIEKHDGGAVPPRLFLSWASLVAARPALTLHLAPPPAARASAD